MVNEETGEEYLSCWKSVPGGFVELFVYGNGATPGKSVPAMVKVRAKLVNKQWVPYARADIADGTPAHKLFIGSPEAIGKLDLTLPSMTSNETFVKDGQDKVRCSLIGFVKIAA